MRALLRFAVLVIIVGAAAAFALNWFGRELARPGPNQAENIVYIAPGTGVRAMAQMLAQEGIIREPLLFLAAVRIEGVESKLKAGEYQMPAAISLGDVVEKIASGTVFRRDVTLPEGLWSSEIKQIINGAPAMNGTIAQTPAEGSILPETYAYIRGEDREKLLAQAQKAMDETLARAWELRASGLPFASKEEALILASIVEKETGVAAERPRIAGVFINRLRAGMMLQSDPTVIYAVTHGESKLDRVLYAHLAVDSPYNTYRHAGLPPGPICNPGKAAIAAVLNPEANDFLYFVADGKGGHVFAKTMVEHNANVARFRTVQQAERAARKAAEAGAAQGVEQAGQKAVDTAPKAP
ncbi:MAG: endolytic transglycosylase MltG [Rhodospirillales bacterium]|nr:endolytic transglycosylase MltG [Alphaproteobacteria bacterium]MCB9986937.1 endolytic transglycosylase MltG [Rhodospirillales bacterium]USO08288.1 MAG: endolytic transglycosylase MltG [Rhodospirillales bacterium]